VSGEQFVSLPVAQDYKRALDGDRGPNTGGMGTYSPCEWVTPEILAETEHAIVAPMVKHLAGRGIDFRGVLFSGVMVENGIPLCLEYNVRFGDPETQSVVRRLGSGFANLLYAAATGQPLVSPEVLDNAVVTVVMASGGYPGRYAKGAEVSIGDMPLGCKVFHAGTRRDQARLITDGGRVLAVSAVAPTIEAARHLSYEALDAILFDRAMFRADIAAPNGLQHPK
jgi:phosphoribosylamine--glycine ligase